MRSVARLEKQYFSKACGWAGPDDCANADETVPIWAVANLGILQIENQISTTARFQGAATLFLSCGR